MIAARSEVNVKQGCILGPEKFIFKPMRDSRIIRAVCVGFFFFILLSTCASAQKVRVNFDYATFRYDSVKTYVELYYSFSRGSLHFVGKDSAFSGLLVFDVGIKLPGADTLMEHRVWKVPVNASDTTADNVKDNLVGQISTAVFPGNYKLIVVVTDEVDTSNSYRMTENLEVPKYLPDKLEASDVELCSTISPGEQDTRDIFYKNTYKVIPNPSGVFGVGMPIVYYYFEVYNISEKPGDTTFTVGYQIRDSFGDVQKSRTRTKRMFGNSSVEVGTVNASNLKTGAYTMIFTVTDSAANEYANSVRRFFVYNPNLGAPASPGSDMAGASLLSSVYAAMGEQQLDKEFAATQYISTPAEKDQYEKLQGVDAKRRFLYEFWKKRNSNSVSPNNDYRTEYLQRVTYANDHFRSGNREGWRTDRGRVYIIYGNPDEIDRHPNETNSKPYEIWYYNSLEGGVSFDFVDRTGFGDYSLVNSTERNEIHDDNWQQYLQTTY